MAEQQRPLPFPDEDSRPYWEAARTHEFKLPKCQQCGHIAFPPRSVCPRCLSTSVDWAQLKGTGTIYTYCVMHDTFIRGMDPPFVVAEVELDDQPGLRVTSNILDCPVTDVRIGMPVEITFEDVTDQVSLPQFRPRK